MESFVSLTSYIDQAQGSKQTMALGKDSYLEINPTNRVVQIEFQGREVLFRFERENALVKITDGTSESRKTMPLEEVIPYLKEKRLDFLVDYALKKVPFLKGEAQG